VVVGRGALPTGGEAFRWTAAGGLVGLGYLPGCVFSETLGVSANGSVIAGGCSGPPGNEAFRWTSGAGMVGLGDLPGGSFSSIANGVSADGSTVVGSGDAASGDQAFIWTATNGMREIAAILTAHGIDLTGWTLDAATSISDDGTVVVGTGTNPSGNREAWLAEVPVPAASAALLQACALLVLAAVRRQAT
jgi:probable HAF family extracellular repeat protein